MIEDREPEARGEAAQGTLAGLGDDRSHVGGLRAAQHEQRLRESLGGGA